MDKKSGETLFLLTVLAVLAGLCFAAVPPGLSSNEEAVQVVQMKNFALNGSWEIQSPAFGLGFEAKDLAGRRGYFESRDGRLYATPPPFFPWVASFFYRALGERAVAFAPILFVFLSALVLGLILDRVMERDVLYWLLLAAFLAGSPVFMKGLIFSGMSLSLFLVTLALWPLASHFGGKPSPVRLFSASLLIGISVVVRMECVLMAGSFWLGAALVLAVQRRMKELGAVLAGCAISLAVLVLHDVALHGRSPGPYAQFLLQFYALSPIRLAALGGAVLLSLGLVVLSVREEANEPLRKAVLSVLSVMILFGAVLLTAARFTVSHLMALFPTVLFVFCGVPARLRRVKQGDGTLEGILAATVSLCLVFGAAVLNPGSWIVFSGWLPMIPLALLLLARERKTLFAAPGMIVVLAFFCGVGFVNASQESRERILQYRDYNAARVAFLDRHTSAGDVVLFQDVGSLELAGPLFFDRVFLIVKDPDEQGRFVRQLRDRGIGEIFVWTVRPLSIEGFNPYGMELPPAYPLPPGSKSCCGGDCAERSYYLVRLETRAGRGGS